MGFTPLCREKFLVSHPLRAPEKPDVTAVAERVASRVKALMGAEGWPEDGEGKTPPLAELYSASIAGRIASGPNAGRQQRVRGRFDAEQRREEDRFEREGARCARVEGFSVHAGVSVRGDDRKGLERLLRYAARPPVATERLEPLPDGRLSYRLKTAWKDGTTHVIFEPLELLGRLAALTPAPRLNLVRFHGVLGPAAKWRSAIVPAQEEVSVPFAEPACTCGDEAKKAPARRPNYSWARLMARVFEIDVLECPGCKGRLQILAAIHPPENTRKILGCLNLPTRAPPLIPAASADINELL